MQEVFVMARKGVDTGLQPVRERIMHAAMQAFIDLGYAEASTLEIATRARVSKRELYALFGSKQAILDACIADRVQGMQIAPKLPHPRSREALATVLVELGAGVLREVSDPVVVTVFRLAISEAHRAPEVAQTLETGRQTVRGLVAGLVVQAQSDGLLGPGDPAHLTAQFLALLWGDLMMSVLLRVREAPGPAEAERRARQAAADFLRLNPVSD
jgi:AcrR family transcriptional regulator